MNDSCIALISDSRVAQEQQRSLLDSIFERITPDQTSQKMELCRARENTPYRDIVLYGNELQMSISTGTPSLQMNLTEHGHTIFDKSALGNNRLLMRSHSDSTFDTKAETAYKYNPEGILVEVIEHSSSSKFEFVRKHTLTPIGWKEEQWNRYGSQFNKMPVSMGHSEFQAQPDGTVLKIARSLDTPLGAVPINRPTIETYTIHDVDGRVKVLK